MQLFVGGLEFFVGGLQLFVRLFELQVHRCQLVVRDTQIVGGLLQFDAGPAEFGDVGERDRHSGVATGLDLEAHERHLEIALAVLAGQGDVVHHHRFGRGVGLLDVRTQLDGVRRDVEGAQVAAELGVAQSEHRSGPLVRRHQSTVDADHQLGNGRQLRRRGLQLFDGSCRGRHRRRQLRRPDAGRLGRRPEDAQRSVDRCEQIGVREHRLGLPEEQQTVLAERVVEPLEDAALRVRDEVHQHVATDEKVEP